MIHPTAVVDDGAAIGEGCRIGPFRHLGPDVVLEEGCELKSHIVVAGRTAIGARTRIYPLRRRALHGNDRRGLHDPRGGHDEPGDRRRRVQCRSDNSEQRKDTDLRVSQEFGPQRHSPARVGAGGSSSVRLGFHDAGEPCPQDRTACRPGRVKCARRPPGYRVAPLSTSREPYADHRRRSDESGTGITSKTASRFSGRRWPTSASGSMQESLACAGSRVRRCVAGAARSCDERRRSTRRQRLPDPSGP
jgi:hypothetical protein